MKQPLRSMMTGLFMLSLFSLASCGTSWCESDCSPCEMFSCDSGCSPCASEENAFFPCDPCGVAPCGSGGCNEAGSSADKCYGKMATYKTNDDCVVDLCQRAPEFATVGSPYPIEISITARKECADVMVNQTLPCGAEFVKSDPPVSPDKNNSLRWSFPHMKCGETQKICVWIKPMKEGCCLAAATVCACPQLCAYTNCGQPVICIKKCGPESACLYCPVKYVIDVCNSGSATAYDVVVQDHVPEGLSHKSGMDCLTYELGNLCPGDKKRICVDFCAAKRGSVTNTATVSFCGGPKCSAEATTLINEPCVQVTKSGPDWAYICKVVDYTITVTNPGDLVLRDVVVDDVSAGGTQIVAAPGAEICCNRALWCIPQMCPGETKTFCVSVRSMTPGCMTNKVCVTTNSDCGQCTSSAEATTNWKGIAATHMCMVDTVDPICVGETSVYRVCVSNRGSADDHNVRLMLRFSDELKPVCFEGPTAGKITGNIVEFAPMEKLGMNENVEYRVTVKAMSSGEARGEAGLSSDALSSPVIQAESTHVY